MVMASPADAPFADDNSANDLLDGAVGVVDLGYCTPAEMVEDLAAFLASSFGIIGAFLCFIGHRAAPDDLESTSSVVVCAGGGEGVRIGGEDDEVDLAPLGFGLGFPRHILRDALLSGLSCENGELIGGDGSDALAPHWLGSWVRDALGGEFGDDRPTLRCRTSWTGGFSDWDSRRCRRPQRRRRWVDILRASVVLDSPAGMVMLARDVFFEASVFSRYLSPILLPFGPDFHGPSASTITSLSLIPKLPRHHLHLHHCRIVSCLLHPFPAHHNSLPFPIPPTFAYTTLASAPSPAPFLGWF